MQLNAAKEAMVRSQLFATVIGLNAFCATAFVAARILVPPGDQFDSMAANVAPVALILSFVTWVACVLLYRSSSGYFGGIARVASTVFLGSQALYFLWVLLGMIGFLYPGGP